MSLRPNVSEYKDFDIEFTKNGLTDDVKSKSGYSSIAQSIKNIILTSPGERPFSDLGGGLNAFFFENDTIETLISLKETVVSILGKHEPRIVVDFNDVTATRTGPGKVTINIRYRLAENLEFDSLQDVNIVISED
jgi:phage baseplate assembly protein W